jgi:signal transduction histidine kinase
MTPTWSAEQLDALNRLTTAARLLSTAVHETGNALQVISGNAEMIEAARSDASKTGERAHRIKVHADQVGARLQFLAALANADSGPPSTVDLRRLAEQTVDLRRYSLNRAKIAVSLAGSAGPVLGSEPELIRLIANLILNAEQAVRDRPAPAIQVTVDIVGASINLAVSDNGPGVPPAARESIFEPFAAGRPPGCGLAVARWIAARHRGALVLDTSLTSGARFVLSLPSAAYSSEAASPMPSR